MLLLLNITVVSELTIPSLYFGKTYGTLMHSMTYVHSLPFIVFWFDLAPVFSQNH